MTHRCTVLAALALGATSALVPPARAAKRGPSTGPAPTTEESAAANAKMLDARADKIVEKLGIDDPAEAARVHGLVVGRYQSLQDFQEKYEPDKKHTADKDPAKAAVLKAMHEKFLADLAAAGLTPEQVERVKDGLTAGKVDFTYRGYLAQYGDSLTDAEKAQILAWLKEAREQALDGRSMEQKSAAFVRYKGRINNYLAKDGHEIKKPAKPAATEPADAVN